MKFTKKDELKAKEEIRNSVSVGSMSVNSARLLINSLDNQVVLKGVDIVDAKVFGAKGNILNR